MVAQTDVLLFGNNQTATLNGDVGSGDSSIVLSTGLGATFPSPAAAQYFVLTMQNLANGDIEICHCTNRSGDILAIDRAQEGSTAKAFPAATSIVQMRLTKGILEKLIQVRFTAADVNKYLRIDSSGLVFPSTADFSVPAGISYLANAETHTAGKATAESTLTISAGAVTVNPELSNSFYLSLTANVTAFAISNGRSGQVISIVLQQDGTGGRTFAFSGTNIVSASVSVDSAASAYTHLSARWCNATSKWLVVSSAGFA